MPSKGWKPSDCQNPPLPSLLPSLQQRQRRGLPGWHCTFCIGTRSPAEPSLGRRVARLVPAAGDGGPCLRRPALQAALRALPRGCSRAQVPAGCRSSPATHSSDCLRLLLLFLPAARHFPPSQRSFPQTLPTVPFSKSTPVSQLSFCWDAHGGMTLPASLWRCPSLCCGFLAILCNQRALLGKGAIFVSLLILT